MDTNTEIVEIKTFIGLDVGNKYSYFCVLDESGEIVDDGKFRTNKASLERMFRDYSEACVAMEVGAHSRWMGALLEDLGLEVLIANSRKVRLIYAGNTKNDRIDAEKLARLARVDPSLLYPIVHRSDDHQADLRLLKARDLVVETRTSHINHVRGALKDHGVKIGRVSANAFAQRVRENVEKEMLTAMNPLLELIDTLTEKIRWYESKLKELVEQKYPEVDLLRQVDGIGPITSLTYALTIGDPSKFKKSRKVGPFLGLCPGQDASGESCPELRITKAGNKNLRRLLVQCAQYILGPFGKDCDLRRWGLKKAEGGKRAKQRAVVGVARKLSVLLHRLWTTGEVYEPLRNADPGAISQQAA